MAMELRSLGRSLPTSELLDSIDSFRYLNIRFPDF
jgi:hypothetical protein